MKFGEKKAESSVLYLTHIKHNRMLVYGWDTCTGKFSRIRVIIAISIDCSMSRVSSELGRNQQGLFHQGV